MIGNISSFPSDCSDGQPVSAHLLLSSLSILCTLDLYYPSFAQALVLSTESYYETEAENLSMTMTPADYIAHVDDRLRQEEQRCDRFFERQSKREVMQNVQRQLISQPSEIIVERGFKDLVNADDIQSLGALYRLLALVKEVEIMRSAWTSYIKVLPSNV
jgi:cullin 4